MTTESPPGVGPNLNLGLPPGLVPPSEQQPIPSAQPPASAAQAQADASLKAALEEAGLDLTQFESPKQAFELLLDMVHNARSAAPYAELGQRVAPEWDAYQQWKQSQVSQQQPVAQQPPQPQAIQEANGDWAIPDFDRDVLRYCEFDESTQRYKPIEPTLARYADQANQFQDRIKSINQKILTAFPDSVLSVVKPYMEKVIAEQFDAKLKEVQAKQEAERARQEDDARLMSVQEKLFKKDSRGNWARNPFSGNMVLTKQGEFFVQERDRFLASYGQDQRAAERYAMDQLDRAEKAGQFSPPAATPTLPSPAPAPQAPPQPQLTPAQIHEQNRQSFMDEALAAQRMAGQRDGTIPDSAREPSRNPLGRPPTAQELVAETLANLG